MRWTEDQTDKITLAATAVAPSLEKLPAEAIAEWERRAEATGIPFDQAIAYLNDKAASHRKGAFREQPGDIIQAFRGIVTTETMRAPVHGAAGLSTEAAADLPMLSDRFVRLPHGVRGSHYGHGIGYAGATPWPPAPLVEAAYREARRDAREQADASPANPYARGVGKWWKWDRPKASRIIAARIGEWYQNGNEPKGSK